ncbi:hypothetical protein L3Q82_020276, partial [Scortum barcoo]
MTPFRLFSKHALDCGEAKGFVHRIRLPHHTVWPLWHIPGTKNIVADALSRDPFAKTVSHRVITEQYSYLLLKLRVLVMMALLDAHDQWEVAVETRAVELIQSVQYLLSQGQDSLPMFKRRPSRRERAGFDAKAMVLFRQRERLKVQN